MFLPIVQKFFLDGYAWQDAELYLYRIGKQSADNLILRSMQEAKNVPIINKRKIDIPMKLQILHGSNLTVARGANGHLKPRQAA